MFICIQNKIWLICQIQQLLKSYKNEFRHYKSIILGCSIVYTDGSCTNNGIYDYADDNMSEFLKRAKEHDSHIKSDKSINILKALPYNLID